MIFTQLPPYIRVETVSKRSCWLPSCRNRVHLPADAGLSGVGGGVGGGGGRSPEGTVACKLIFAFPTGNNSTLWHCVLPCVCMCISRVSERQTGSTNADLERTARRNKMRRRQDRPFLTRGVKVAGERYTKRGK